jgi:antitoxin (DNA-binding transcriptional repressor) of toxin-antitoxin stability system
MDTTLSEHDLANALAEVLDRAHRGERFIIERDGERLAVLAPPPARPASGITGQDLLDRLGGLRMPGDGFAEDIEAARAALLPLPASPWSD